MNKPDHQDAKATELEKRGCILIVDDDPDIRAAKHRFIDRAGFQTSSAESAEEALTQMLSAPADVVVTDIKLPGIDGLALTDRVRREFSADVIVMTGYSSDYSYEEAVNKGASDFVFKPVRLEELLLRIRRVMRERQMAREQRRMLEKLRNLAITDGLTKLYNSRHFYQHLKIEIGRANRYNHALALLMMDIDHFKRFNDAYGHLEGDKVLSRIADIIRTCLRSMDSAYRYGGEEFAILLPETSADEAAIVAQRLRKAVKHEGFCPAGSAPASITISIGVTEHDRGESRRSFVQRADQALYQSKNNGRDMVSVLYPADAGGRARNQPLQSNI